MRRGLRRAEGNAFESIDLDGQKFVLSEISSPNIGLIYDDVYDSSQWTILRNFLPTRLVEAELRRAAFSLKNFQFSSKKNRGMNHALGS